MSMFSIFRDRKSTRLNSSHLVISYAVFCLKKKQFFDLEADRELLDVLVLLLARLNVDALRRAVRRAPVASDAALPPVDPLYDTLPSSVARLSTRERHDSSVHL